jgi:hypothetical protein
MPLSELPCTHCQGAGLELHAAGEAQCRFCGTLNAVDGVICPRCETINALEAIACAACRHGLVRRCPACATANWSGAELCANCGRALDTMSALGARLSSSHADRLNELARDAAALKTREEEDSQRRLAELNAIEARRQALLSESRRRRDQQQRAWLVVLSLVVLSVVGLAAVIGLATLLSN